MKRITPACISLTVCALAVMLAAGRVRAAGDTSQAMGVGLMPIGDVTPLETGPAIERELARGQEHRFRLGLMAGQYASVVVEQRGVNVAVQLCGADGNPLAAFDDEPRKSGQETVEVVADVDGVYTLIVKPSPGVITSGGYAIRLVQRQPASDADRAMLEARNLRMVGGRLFEVNKAEEAQPMLERAVVLTERARGPDDAQVGRVVAELAAVYMDLPDYPRAEAQYLRSISILEKALGPEHPATAFTRSRLANLYGLTGQRPKAEALIRPAIDTIEKTLGSDHLWFVKCLSTQANLLFEGRDLERAETILLREMGILEKIDYTKTTLYAGILNNLGDVYGSRRDYARAEDFLRRAVAVQESLRGPDDYFLSNPLLNLGVVAREQKEYAKAEAYYRRGLAIREKVVGPDHPELFLFYNNLANVYYATGDSRRSLEMHRHALLICEKSYGPYHSNTLISLGNLARVSAAAGDLTNAIQYQRRADAVLERQLALNLAVGSERQKLLFVRGIADRTDRTISLHLRQAPDNADAAELAAVVLLQRKGRVLDALIDTVTAVRQRIANASDQQLLDQLNATTADLARLALTASDVRTPEERRSAIAELDARKERLEAELADHSAEFRAQMQPVTLEAVLASLPSDAALLEFTVFRPYNPRAERTADAYGPPHYAAYVLRRGAAPRGVDLGDAKTIDNEVDVLRQALRDPSRTDVAAHAREVYDRVMRPLRESLREVSRLLISPDGQLNLLPFEALADEDGHYLLECFATSYLTSGRDLLRMQEAHATPGKPVIFADPVFGEPPMTRLPAPAEKSSSSLARRSVTTGDDLSSVYFAPLAATADEARAIKSLFPEATLFSGPQATKTTLQRVTAPRMLHIASHAFFLTDRHIDVENPLLRSGVALAGANLTRDALEDGILTALEASGLNLWGTKLVTLSACDTGVGEVRNGEGVYGLRRAFMLAGAETVVMSLWSVNDAAARETMVAYYRGLQAGLGRGDALRQAKLAMLSRKARQHPFYWASFIESGEWADLDGVR